jgi:hypothetical protein
MEHASYLCCIFLFLPGAMKSPPSLGEALFFSFFLSFLRTLFDFQLFSVGGGVVLSFSSSSSSSFLYPFRKLVLPDPA